MAKRGSVFSHPSQAEIDQGLLATVPYRPLAGQFEISPSVLCRHPKNSPPF